MRARSGSAPRVLGSLVLFRVVLAVAVLAASGHALLPGFPEYHYDPLSGDAYGYYSAVRELLATWRREAALLLPALVAAAVVVAVAVRRRPGPAALVVVFAWCAGALGTLLVALTRFSGAPTIGWPLVWSVPLLPYRTLGLPLDPDVAYGVGTVLSLALVGAIVVGSYALGVTVSGSRAIAYAAASLMAFWPLAALLVGGHRGTLNGTWQGELGISLTVEPLSTALVLFALVLVARRGVRALDAAVAGSLLGAATVVRLSNVLIAACVLVALALRNRSLGAWFAGTATAFAPVVLAYWPQGYAKIGPPTYPEHPFAWSYARTAWTDSLLWRPVVLAVLVPLAVVGTLRVARWVALLLWGCVAVTAAFFTFYRPTPLHPRFLFVVLPLVLVLWAAGVAEVATRALRKGRLRPLAR